MPRRTITIIIFLLISYLLATSCACHSNANFQEQVRHIAKPYEFSILNWEVSALLHKVQGLFDGANAEIDDVETVKRYFTSVGQAAPAQSNQAKKAILANKAERVLAKQIKKVLAEEHILNPLHNFLPLRVIFPPVNFEFEPAPDLLVISPRDKIELLQRVPLDSDLTVREKEEIERKVDDLGVSSLVVELGGVGFTYPAMVTESTDVHSVLDAIVEEWLHQYMAFKPLGFLYLLDALGIRPDYQIATMNETVAGIASKEISEKVFQRYYASEDWAIASAKKTDPEFNREMRAIRLQVDEYLAQGKVKEAEEFMWEKRDYLAAKGYYIRKLNQAYFAFHGTYAYKPTSVSPIGEGLKELRKQCSSLKGFLDKVTRMTSYEQLRVY